MKRTLDMMGEALGFEKVKARVVGALGIGPAGRREQKKRKREKEGVAHAKKEFGRGSEQHKAAKAAAKSGREARIQKTAEISFGAKQAEKERSAKKKAFKKKRKEMRGKGEYKKLTKKPGERTPAQKAAWAAAQEKGREAQR